MSKLLFSGESWHQEDLRRYYDACEEIALEDLGLSIYPNEQRIVTGHGMLEVYKSIGLPFMYRHWSFEKNATREARQYELGKRGLAHELVINSDPCISYYMLENTAAMQLLTTAHAAMGHNHFFKNNLAFREWTDAKLLYTYAKFAQEYVATCEEKHGSDRVERILDAAHALMSHGVFMHKRQKLTKAQQKERAKRVREHAEQSFNLLYHSPSASESDETDEVKAQEDLKKKLGLPEENLLYFIEKFAPRLEEWERELVRIVRFFAQYFRPQQETKVMNEGCASFVHNYICLKLWEQGRIDNAAWLEILHSNSGVLSQPAYDSRQYGGINPYALGNEVLKDIRRICEDPTSEDKDFLPTFAGTGDWRAAFLKIWRTYRDTSYIEQFLSPAVIRKFRLFELMRNTRNRQLLHVSAIHDEDGYGKIRSRLARHYNQAERRPHIEVVDAALRGNRRLWVRHRIVEGRRLLDKKARPTLAYLQSLWQYPVTLESVDEDGDVVERWKADKNGIVEYSGE